MSTTSLCGTVNGTVDEVLLHTATCPICRSRAEATRAAASGPMGNTVLSRQAQAADMEAMLVRYIADLRNDPGHASEYRVTWLASIIGHAQVALWYETDGSMGDQHASPTKVLRAGGRW